MARKKTKEEVIVQLHNKYPNIDIISDYNGTHKKVTFRCNNDNYEWDGYFNNVITYGCPVCSGAIITDFSFKKQMGELYPNVSILNEYKSMKDKLQCECKIDHHKWEVYPRTLRDKGCPICYGSKTRRWTDAEYKEKINEIHDGNIIALESYVNMNAKILHKCIKHNREFMSKPSKIINRGQGCPECGKENHKNSSFKRRKTTDEFKKEVYDLVGDEYEVLDDYITSYEKIKFRHFMKDGSFHDFVMTPNVFLEGQRCSCCANAQVYKGFNDFNTRRPDLVKYLVNKAEGETHLRTSGDYTDWECDSCHTIYEKTFREVDEYGLCCPKCSDGISYPNKFMFNLLSQIVDDLDFLDREISPIWCKFPFRDKTKTGIYDIYFGINNKQYFIELDGGLGHGNKMINGFSREEALYIDKQKDELALEQGIEVIRINCDYASEDRYEFIYNNIVNSKLKDIININKLDFDMANKMSLQSLLVKACNLWNEGNTVKCITNTLHVHESTITNYLKKGSKYNMCKNYSAEESKTRSFGNEVYCITTNKKFRTIVSAADYYGLEAGQISKCCRKVATFGGYYKGQKLVWIYYNEYLKMSKEEIENYIPMDNNNFTKVICLNTLQVFDKIISAAEWCKVKKTSGISACCKGRYKTSGKHPITQEPLRWMYYDDYLKLNKDKISEEEQVG